MEEVAADFGGWVVDRVHLVTRRLHFLTRNHQFLHAARCGQFAAGALLLVVNAQEAHEDDDDDRQQTGKVGNCRKVDGDRPCLDRETGIGMLPPPKSPMPPVRIGSAIPTIVSTSGISSRPASKFRLMVATIRVRKTKIAQPMTQKMR